MPRQPEESFVSTPLKESHWGEFLLAGLALAGVVSGVATPPTPQVAVESVETIEAVALSAESLRYEIANSDQIAEAADWAVQRSLTKIPSKPGENRHELRARVHSQDLADEVVREEKSVHYDGSDVVVIAFEGTATFHPRKASVVQGAAAHLREQGLRVDGSQGSLSATVDRALAGVEGREPRWSGLSYGPLESLVEHPALGEKTQWLSYPSEELEVLSSPEAYQSTGWGHILRDAKDSFIGELDGVDGAFKAVREIQEQAAEQGKEPRFVLLSHSSGGRSLVKFLEKAKAIRGQDGEPLRFSSAVTIDPVREAHEALFEGTGSYLAQGAERGLNRALSAVGLPEMKPEPALVKHRLQPESLYAPSNVESFLNFFQRQDTEGIKFGPQVGIHGSPVVGATNYEVEDVGTGGHGEIAINEAVQALFLKAVRTAADGS